MEQSADYIVAGAGSAGCILARRLADTGASVILFEARGPDRTRLVGEHCASLIGARLTGATS